MWIDNGKAVFTKYFSLELSISRAGMRKRLTLEALPNLLNCIEKQPTVEII